MHIHMVLGACPEQNLQDMHKSRTMACPEQRPKSGWNPTQARFKVGQRHTTHPPPCICSDINLPTKKTYWSKMATFEPRQGHSSLSKTQPTGPATMLCSEFKTQFLGWHWTNPWQWYFAKRRLHIPYVNSPKRVCQKDALSVTRNKKVIQDLRQPKTSPKLLDSWYFPSYSRKGNLFGLVVSDLREAWQSVSTISRTKLRPHRPCLVTLIPIWVCRRTSVPSLHTLFQGKRPGFDRVIHHLLICLLLLTCLCYWLIQSLRVQPTFIAQPGPEKSGKTITNVGKIG